MPTLTFTDAELDQLSGILDDFMVYTHIEIRRFSSIGHPNGTPHQAIKFCERWLTRAADLRDKIEAR